MKAESNLRQLVASLLLAAAVLFAVLFGILRIGPIVDGFFPVVSDAVLADVESLAGNAVRFRYLFTKHRACPAIRADWYFDYKGAIGVAIVDRDSLTVALNRPLGRNLSVWWTVTKDNPIPGSYFVVLRYSCGLPWETTSTLGPFRIER